MLTSSDFQMVLTIQKDFVKMTLKIILVDNVLLEDVVTIPLLKTLDIMTIPLSRNFLYALLLEMFKGVLASGMLLAMHHYQKEKEKKSQVSLRTFLL